MEDRFGEFERHIWDHPSDPFQIKYDVPPRLTKADVDAVALVLREMNMGRGRGRPPYSRVAMKLLSVMRADSRVLPRLMQLAGLTRRKIVNDVRPAARRLGSQLPNEWKHLLRQELWRRTAGPYLTRRLWAVLKPLRRLRGARLTATLEALNWATYPGYIRQQRAKEAGHEAERRLAEILNACGIPFEPAEKLTNPLCNDILVFGESIDLVVPSATRPKVCFKSTVHTSPLGEYGKDKVGPALIRAKRHFARKLGIKRPRVVALIDGEGHFHNAKALRSVLKGSDEFVQFDTLWKAVVICGSLTGRKKRIELSPAEVKAHFEFLKRYRYLNEIVAPGTLAIAVNSGAARVER